LLLVFRLGYRQVTCISTSDTNSQSACSRYANIGGIQTEENKSQKLYIQ